MQNVTVASLIGYPREPVKFSNFSDSAEIAVKYGKNGVQLDILCVLRSVRG